MTDTATDGPAPLVVHPVGLVLTGRPVLVVGGGPVAARKAEGLAAAGARVTLVAPAVSPAARAIPGIVVQERTYERGEAAGYRLVVTATGVREVDQAVFDDAEAAGVWVNSADDPARCSFVLPAVLRRGPVTVAVSTGGASPALAGYLRDRIGEVVDPEVGDAALALATERAGVQAAGGSTEALDWRPRVEAALAEARARRSPSD